MDYQNNLSPFQFEVTPQEEEELRNLPKLPAICQFMAIFKNVLKLNMNPNSFYDINNGAIFQTNQYGNNGN